MPALVDIQIGDETSYGFKFQMQEYKKDFLSGHQNQKSMISKIKGILKTKNNNLKKILNKTKKNKKQNDLVFFIY